MIRWHPHKNSLHIDIWWLQDCNSMAFQMLSKYALSNKPLMQQSPRNTRHSLKRRCSWNTRKLLRASSQRLETASLRPQRNRRWWQNFLICTKTGVMVQQFQPASRFNERTLVLQIIASRMLHCPENALFYSWHSRPVHQNQSQSVGNTTFCDTARRDVSSHLK